METIAVCDSEPVAIEGLRSIIEPMEGMRVVAGESTLADGMDAVRDLMPSIYILDTSFGMRNVLENLRVLRYTEPPPKVIIWGGGITDSDSVRLLQAGATATIRKTVSLDTLLQCIHSVAGGTPWVDRDLAPQQPVAVKSTPSPLTAREHEVMELVERGLKNKEIGRELGIRTGTVKIHLKHIFEKTGIRGRYGLALSGLRQKGLLAIAV